MTLVKLCGLMRLEDIAVANRLRPEMVGFVFAQGSRRQVSAEDAERLSLALARGIHRVGVFMHESLEEILSLVHAGIIDRVQLHAPMTHEEAEAQMAAIRAAVDVPIIRAFGVPATGTNVVLTEALASSADYCLFDNARGGSGEPFNHQVLRYYPAPYLLSGGLTPENVEAAIDLLSPLGVDVSSGIEVDGRKSAEKMTAFVEAVHRADQRQHPAAGRWPSGAKGKNA